MEPYDLFPPSEDVYLGTPDGRFLSPVRRFFCLLATFDLLFTVLLWTLCVILMKGGQTTITDALEDQVLRYNLYTSIFDTVMGSLIRFTILILFYALLRCDTVIPVSLTTFASCAFLLAKVFVFRWDLYANATYVVILVLSNFILSWSEAWFFDFRVVPQERQAAMYFQRQQAHAAGGRGVIPWLGHSVSQIARSAPASTFYSPLESPLHSDEENDFGSDSMEHRAGTQDTIESLLWLQHAPQMAEGLMRRIDTTLWTQDKGSDEFFVFHCKSSRKIFMISGILPASVKSVADELFHNFDTMPAWNPNVTHCEILQRLDRNTDVSYQVSRGGGPVSPRDFVTLRHINRNMRGLSTVIVTESVKHNARPSNNPRCIRGTNGVSGWQISPDPSGDVGRCEFRWLLDVDLHMSSMLSSFVDKAIVNAAIETLKCFRQRLELVQETTAVTITNESSNANRSPRSSRR